MIRGMVMNRNNKETFIPKTGTGMSFFGKQQLVNKKMKQRKLMKKIKNVN